MIKIEVHFSIRLYWQGRERCLRRERQEEKSENSGERQEQTVEKPVEKLVDICEQAISQLSASRGKSTQDNYRTALRSLVSYAGRDVSTEDLSVPLLQGWQQHLLQRGLTRNTISCYMRSMRSLLGQMMEVQHTKQLFEKVYTGNSRTDKRSLSVAELHRLQELPLGNNTSLALARDLFMFSVLTLGMPFVDIAFLRKKQIQGGYITYQRHKTGQRIHVKVEPPARSIMKRYRCPNGEFVFPILQQGTMHEYEMKRSQYNRLLRRLGRLAGISRPLTSYAARHSWASLAYHQNIQLPVISKALGHTSPKTTTTYLREIDDTSIDEGNHRLVALITGNNVAVESDTSVQEVSL